jgi:hypothetical protein
LNLAVVTFTKDPHSLLLSRCCASVLQDLPAGAKHHVIYVENASQFAEARIRALGLTSVVAFVDYDDQVVNSGLSLAWKAMQEAQVGVVFTDEALVTLDGSILELRDGDRTYEELVYSPWRVHHLSLVNVAHVSNQISNVRNCAGSIDRWIRMLAIESGGALHVPVLGYHWTHHSGMMSRETNIKRYPVSPILTRKGVIPQFSLTGPD